MPDTPEILCAVCQHFDGKRRCACSSHCQFLTFIKFSAVQNLSDADYAEIGDLFADAEMALELGEVSQAVYDKIEKAYHAEDLALLRQLCADNGI